MQHNELSQEVSANTVSVSAVSSSAPDRKRKQVHFWLGCRDYIFLRNLASQEGESMANLLRRMVRNLRASSEQDEKCA